MHTTELYSKGLVEFVGAELRIWRADYKIICNIKLHINYMYIHLLKGFGISHSHIVQRSTVN